MRARLALSRAALPSLSLALMLLSGCSGGEDSGGAGASRAEVRLEDATFYLGAGAGETDALAVSGGVVVAVGDAARAMPADEVVSLGGAFAAPGFHDAHTHLLPGSFVMSRLVMLGSGSMSRIVGDVEDYAQANPDEPWIIGFGWIYALVEEPDGRLLDAVAPDRPVFVADSSGHNALVNSVVLDLLGITADTPDPEGGTIVRDPETGEPTGLLQEDALALVSGAALQDYTEQDFIDSMRDPLEQMREAGLTSISDVMALPGFDLAYPWILTDLDERGELPLRVHYYVPLFDADDVEDAAALGATHSSARVRFAGGKVWVDGSSSTAESWVSEPLVGTEDDFGSQYFTAAEIEELVQRAEAASMPLKLHANGDAAVAACLDAFEAAAASGGLQQQHVLEHVVLISDADRARMAELGVVASTQPTHATVAGGGEMPEAWGEERYEAAYDLRALHDAGVPVALGTDWPVWPTLKAPVNLWAATSLDDHALTAAEALDAYTAGSARAAGMAGTLGCLDVGCAADLTLLDADPRALEGAELAQVGVLDTYIAGERVP